MIELPKDPIDGHYIPCWLTCSVASKDPQEHCLIFRKAVKYSEILGRSVMDQTLENVWLLYEKIPGQPHKFCHLLPATAKDLNTFHPSLRAALIDQCDRLDKDYRYLIASVNHISESLIQKLKIMENLPDSKIP